MMEQRLYGKLNKEIQKGILTSLDVTPTAEGETITPEKGYDGFSSVTVPAEPNLIPENIVEGKNILGVEGTAIELYKDKNLTPENLREGVTVYEGTVAETTGELEPFVEDPNLIPGNIKDGVVIYENTPHEVVGTCVPESIDLAGLLGGTLTDIVLPDSVTSLRKYCFTGYSNLIKVEGDSVTAIGDYAFDGLQTNLTSATFGQLQGIGQYAFRNCRKLSGIVFETIDGPIGASAFQNCYELLIDLSDCDISEIGSNAFSETGTGSSSSTIVYDMRKSRSLTELTMSSMSTGSNISKVKKFLLPSTVQSIANNAASNSPTTYFYFSNSSAPAIQAGSFSGVTLQSKILAPYNYLNIYKTSTNWTQTYIQNILLGYAYEGTFTEGQTLPTQDSSGLALTWYTDVNKTNVVTTCPAGSPELYCWG